MKLRAAASLAIWMILTSSLWADSTTSHPVVIELFTSQGCSSCPPADKLLHDLTGRPDVIPLALHVDYWDYIGWEDSFARAENTLRQRKYARAGGRKMIYTPQIIVNGQQDIAGGNAMKLADAIALHKAEPSRVSLRAGRDDDILSIQAETLAPVAAPLTVLVVRYTPLQSVTITRGENAGHTIDYANVVDEMTVVGHWDGGAPLSLSAQMGGSKPAAVLLQYPGPGAIVAAARVD
ncbi:DUF1223 domain-containing protein [Sedimentitalea sp. JM2-8]|uniref:DUF1223 domain-containing protein n=1 Tax=Sedimentitalea xiamensis TaxID=3050037 RepID=A0ABT7FG71_9RHOB|nr:DUF1223 domain-containing protein [Sedimentitalea xiamensis]MDK3074141.1 DUF1223 domain-containing protein [Sedimentitalea xiamensis]